MILNILTWRRAPAAPLTIVTPEALSLRVASVFSIYTRKSLEEDMSFSMVVAAWDGLRPVSFRREGKSGGFQREERLCRFYSSLHDGSLFMPRTYQQLDLDERRTISRLLNAKVAIAAIARQLSRHPSTLHREISRNHFREQREDARCILLQDLLAMR